MLSAAMPDAPAFEARCEQLDGAVVVVVHGELDLGSADSLRAVLRAPEAQAPTVVLDLRNVTFIDSSGLSVIVGHSRRAETDHVRFAIAIGGASSVERLFELTGLRGTLPLVETPEAVITW
jgi:anti-sigma B factor antagonist